MKTDLYDDDDGCVGKIKKNKICVGITSFLVIVGIILIIVISSGGKTPVTPPGPEPEPSRTIIKASPEMVAVFAMIPDLSKYN